MPLPPLSTGLAPILLAIKAQLVFSLPKMGGLNPLMPALTSNTELIHIMARDPSRTPRFQGDQDVLLRAGSIGWNQSVDTSAGRILPWIKRPLLVTARTRCNTDLSDSDYTRLTDPALGHLALEEGLIDVLLDYIPQLADGTWLVQEPLHPIDYPPEEEQPEGQARDWIETNMAFHLSYVLPLTQTGPGY